MARTKNNPGERDLAQIFLTRNGYVRLQNTDRAKEGTAKYKKGDEVRLMAASATELRLIRRLLHAAGFMPGKPFLKNKKWCQPLYGRESTARFLEIVKKGMGNRHLART